MLVSFHRLHQMKTEVVDVAVQKAVHPAHECGRAFSFHVDAYVFTQKLPEFRFYNRLNPEIFVFYADKRLSVQGGKKVL